MKHFVAKNSDLVIDFVLGSFVAMVLVVGSSVVADYALEILNFFVDSLEALDILADSLVEMDFGA